MKLYFSPGACSLHPTIAAQEAGIKVDRVRVDLRTHKTQDGKDYYAINPKGAVPALELDDGSLLTEGAVIVQYIADRKPESKLLPAAGTIERYRVQEWLNFIASEIHKTFSLLFGGSEEIKDYARAKLAKKFDWLETELKAREYLTLGRFTVADGYLFNMLRWAKPTGIDLAKWPAMTAFHDRVAQRPAVVAALEAEK